jgi:hypothetical protein
MRDRTGLQIPGHVSRKKRASFGETTTRFRPPEIVNGSVTGCQSGGERLGVACKVPLQPCVQEASTLPPGRRSTVRRGFVATTSVDVVVRIRSAGVVVGPEDIEFSSRGPDCGPQVDDGGHAAGAARAQARNQSPTAGRARQAEINALGRNLFLRDRHGPRAQVVREFQQLQKRRGVIAEDAQQRSVSIVPHFRVQVMPARGPASAVVLRRRIAQRRRQREVDVSHGKELNGRVHFRGGIDVAGSSLHGNAPPIVRGWLRVEGEARLAPLHGDGGHQWLHQNQYEGGDGKRGFHLDLLFSEAEETHVVGVGQGQPRLSIGNHDRLEDWLPTGGRQSSGCFHEYICPPVVPGNFNSAAEPWHMRRRLEAPPLIPNPSPR